MKSWKGSDKTLFDEYTKINNEREALYNSIHGSFEEREESQKKTRIEYLKKRYANFDYNNDKILLKFDVTKKVLHIYLFDNNDKPQELSIYSFSVSKSVVSNNREYVIY